jgi:acyl carrier protein
MKNKEEILGEIQVVFREVFKNEELIVDFESNADSISEWDSITNILLIDAIEEKFAIEFPIDVIYEAKNIGDWIEFILNT